MRQTVIGVIGSGEPHPETGQLAFRVGSEIARLGASVICGGLGGVMEAAARGAHQNGGTVIGVLPGGSSSQGNPWLTVSVATGLGEARNLAVVRSAAAVIAVGGSYGTLSEIAFCLKFGVPVVGLKTWRLQHDMNEMSDPLLRATEPEEAVRLALLEAERGGSRP